MLGHHKRRQSALNRKGVLDDDVDDDIADKGDVRIFFILILMLN